MLNKIVLNNDEDRNIYLINKECQNTTDKLKNEIKEHVTNYKKDYKIYMVEIQEENRKVLKNLCNDAPDILQLHETKDFLQFINHIQYDLKVMNPPFHLRKSQFTYLDRDYYDMDFVYKCYIC